MQIFVDADACPVVGIVEKVAKEHSVPVTLLCDTNHVLSSDYSEVVVVGAGADAVDYKLISICHKGDIVVSQDYGVAAMALGKGLKAKVQWTLALSRPKRSVDLMRFINPGNGIPMRILTRCLWSGI